MNLPLSFTTEPTRIRHSWLSNPYYTDPNVSD